MRFVLAALVLALAACDSGVEQAKAKQERRAQRAALAASHEAGPVKASSHDVPGGKVTVLDVPVSDDEGWTLERQKCFVWRDDATKTSSISCPARDVYVGR